MPKNINRNEYEVIPGENYPEVFPGNYYPNELETEQCNQSKKTTPTPNFNLFNKKAQKADDQPGKKEPIATTNHIFKK